MRRHPPGAKVSKGRRPWSVFQGPSPWRRASALKSTPMANALDSSKSQVRMAGRQGPDFGDVRHEASKHARVDLDPDNQVPAPARSLDEPGVDRGALAPTKNPQRLGGAVAGYDAERSRMGGESILHRPAFSERLRRRMVPRQNGRTTQDVFAARLHRRKTSSSEAGPSVVATPAAPCGPANLTRPIRTRPAWPPPSDWAGARGRALPVASLPLRPCQRRSSLDPACHLTNAQLCGRP